MHGRLKVKTTEQQREEQRKARAKKLELFRHATKCAFSKRQCKELDKDALKITTEILGANPEFYSMWNFRKEILLEIKQSSTEEDLITLFKGDLEFTELCLRNNPKSYGAWHHRCWIMQTTPKPDWEKEIKLCDYYLSIDERNFHCWDYRRFIVQEAGITCQDEFKFTDEKIAANFSNYSSWHYRSKLLPFVHPGATYKNIDEEKLLEEFELIQNACFTDPNDQSAWFYHRWLLGREEKETEIYSLVLLKDEGRVVVSFTNEVPVSAEKPLDLEINGSKVDTRWNPPCEATFYGFSPVWVADVPIKSYINENCDNIQIKVVYNQVLTIAATMDNSTERVRQMGSVLARDLFRSQFSAAAVQFLNEELESCQQLQELEPENKWPMLTSALLMQAIDSQQYQSKISDDLEKLKDLDVGRASYYDDLRSKLIVENAIEKQNPDDESLSICGMNLTVLYHTNFMMQLSHLSLQNNRITRISGIYYLQCLKSLNMDDNLLEDCNGLQCLASLESFSARNNRLKDEQSVRPLYQCCSLNSVNLENNPVCADLEGVINKFKQNIDGIEFINGQAVV